MQPEIEKTTHGWILKIPASNGKTQELHCASEEMAQRMAASLARKTPVRAQAAR